MQEWAPTLVGIAQDIQDSLPHSSEVKQKLRSWNKALSKHYPRALQKKGNFQQSVPPPLARNRSTRWRVSAPVERTYKFRFSEASSNPPNEAPNRNRSASVDAIYEASLAKAKADLERDMTDHHRRSQPPTADQHAESREPLLGSIAENGEYQRPRSESFFRQDPIFALHTSRVCPAGAPPIFVESLPFVNTVQRPASVLGSVELTKINDMYDLRTSINDTRALQGAPSLAVHQALCAEAEILATMYDVQQGAAGNRWSTEMGLQEDTDTLELIGPPFVGGRVTAKMWAEGRYSRDTQRSHANFSHLDHKECQCHNFKVWEAITDPKWRAIGLSRTEEELRWVVVLSEQDGPPLELQ